MYMYVILHTLHACSKVVGPSTSRSASETKYAIHMNPYTCSSKGIQMVYVCTNRIPCNDNLSFSVFLFNEDTKH